MRAARSVPVRIITHNVRYATESPFKGEERWPVRCPRLCAELVFNAMHPAETFICLQEVLHNQLEDIYTALNAAASPGISWAYIGVGRDDGKKAGEYSPIFYRASAWKLDYWKTAWLSETPERPSRGWDAACTRIVTIGFFTHLASLQKVVVLSTHLDHEGPISRANSARLILKWANECQVSNKMHKLTPVLLAGDFNSPPNDEAYKIMTSPGSIMKDARLCVPKGNQYGHDMTFTSFGEPGATPSLIDFIFSNEPSVVHTFGVLENRFDDGIFLSDHRAIVADLVLSDT